MQEISITPQRLIMFGLPDTHKIVSCTLNEQVFDLPDFLTVVYHKNVIKQIQLKEVGQSMNYILVLDSAGPHELTSDSVCAGIALYQVFDEATGVFNSWLYKQAPSRKNYYDALFAANPSRDIQCIQEQYLRLEWQTLSWNQIEQMIRKAIDTNDDNVCLGIFCWMMIAYGTFSIKNGMLFPSKMVLPFQANLAGKQELFYNFFWSLQRFGYVLTVSEINQGQTDFLQVSCSDFEILAILAEYLKPVETINQISTLQESNTAKEKLMDFFENVTISDQQSRINQLKSSTIKLVVKR